MLGDLKANIRQAQNSYSQQVTYKLMEFELVELLHHICQYWRLRPTKTWSRVRRGILLRSRCNYILGTDLRQFEMVGIRDVHNYSSDHFAMQAIVLQCSMRCHRSYLWGRRYLPLSLPVTEDLIPEERKFQKLKALEPPTPTPHRIYPHTPTRIFW